VWSYLSTLYEVVLIDTWRLEVVPFPGMLVNELNMPLFPSTQQVMDHLLGGPGLKYLLGQLWLTGHIVGGWASA